MNLLDSVMAEHSIRDDIKQLCREVLVRPTSELPTGKLVVALSLLTTMLFSEGQMYDDVPPRLRDLQLELNRRVPVNVDSAAAV